jgi:hypothetical protein
MGMGGSLITVIHKGRPIVPADLMTRTIKQCGISRVEISWRIKFAERYPTKKETSRALEVNPSWTQMKNALKEKKHTPAKPKSYNWKIPQLLKQIDLAHQHHTELSRAEVKDLERALVKIQELLNEIDRNDAEKAEKKSS